MMRNPTRRWFCYQCGGYYRFKNSLLVHQTVAHGTDIQVLLPCSYAATSSNAADVLNQLEEAVKDDIVDQVRAIALASGLTCYNNFSANFLESNVRRFSDHQILVNCHIRVPLALQNKAQLEELRKCLSKKKFVGMISREAFFQEKVGSDGEILRRFDSTASVLMYFKGQLQASEAMFDVEDKDKDVKVTLENSVKRVQFDTMNLNVRWIRGKCENGVLKIENVDARIGGQVTLADKDKSCFENPPRPRALSVPSNEIMQPDDSFEDIHSKIVSKVISPGARVGNNGCGGTNKLLAAVDNEQLHNNCSFVGMVNRDLLVSQFRKQTGSRVKFRQVSDSQYDLLTEKSIGDVDAFRAGGKALNLIRVRDNTFMSCSFVGGCPVLRGIHYTMKSVRTSSEHSRLVFQFGTSVRHEVISPSSRSSKLDCKERFELCILASGLTNLDGLGDKSDPYLKVFKVDSEGNHRLVCLSDF
jgi:hypothetical protein